MYLKDERPFLTVSGEPAQGADGDMGLGDIIEACLNMYAPSQGQVITVKEWGKLNHVFDVLDAGPDDDGYFVFESEDYGVMKKVIGWTAANVLRRNSPRFTELVDASKNTKV